MSLPGMGNVGVTSWVEHAETFATVNAGDHRTIRLEPGNRRFDGIQLIEDPTHSALYEADGDEASFMSHQQTAYRFGWRDAVEPLMAEKGSATRLQGRSPETWA
jgi:(4S)-4-hydroxy-5-phosphonooxypentane-2,3-dione isomerase